MTEISRVTTLPAHRVKAVRFQTARVIVALILRESSSRFGKSVGGYFWSIAEPAAGILLLSIAFSYLLTHPPIGTSFFLFYACGIIPLIFFNTLSGALAQSVASNKGLLTYPVVSIIEVIAARAILELVTYSVVFIIIVSFIIYVDNIIIYPNYPQIILAIFLTAFLGVAVGMANCVLFIYFPVWRNIWRIITRPMLIISGVMFTYEKMPDNLKDWLWYNPLLQIIGIMRGGMYSTYNDFYVSYIYIIGFCLFLIAISSFIIRNNQARLIQN